MTSEPHLAAVIGWPIAHSRSPRLHRHWLDRYGINGHYIPIARRPEAFESGLRALATLGFRGTNVTIPHKEAALALASQVTHRARTIGAANTLTFLADGEIHADNTDGYGFIANLRQEAPGWSTATGPALVLGSGGSARAVVAGLIEAGVPELRIANRNRARAEALRDFFGGQVTVVDWSDATDAAASAAIIVNTTPVGMNGDDAAPIALAGVPRETLIADIVYGAEPTPFVAEARRLGLRTVDGVGMLLHQAAPGFERWFGRRPEVDAELRAAVLAP
jgi:shikimate dehydrogenase